MNYRGLLLDRDGVINVDRAYVGRREQFQFIDGLFPFLRWVQDIGFRLAVITNQSGVARGYYTEKDFDNLTQWMLGELAQQGIVISRIYASFEHNQGTIPALTRESFWRKPNPGMILSALQHLELDPDRSVFIGDKESDMDAAKRAGVKTRVLLDAPPSSYATHQAQNFLDVQAIMSGLFK